LNLNGNSASFFQKKSRDFEPKSVFSGFLKKINSLFCMNFYIFPFYAYLLAFVRPSMAIIQAFEGIFFPKVA